MSANLWVRTLECAAVENDAETRAGIAGWIVWAAVVLLGLAGAASSPSGILIGVPSTAQVALAVAATAALAATAGLRPGRPALGLIPLLVLIAAGIPMPGLGALTGGPLLALALALAAVALATARPKWTRRAFVPALLLLHLAAAARVQWQVGPEGDEPHYLMVAASLLEDGDLALQDDYAAGRYRAFHPADLEPHYRVRGRDGAIYSLHAVGLSLLILPAYAAGGYAAVSFFMAVLGVATAWQVRELVGETLADDGVAEAVGWIAGLTPPLLHFAGLVFTEVPAALGLTVALRAALAPQSVARAWGAGLVLASLPWLNVRYAILAVIVLLAAMARRPSLRVAAGWWIPMVTSAAALAVYHQVLYGFFDPRRVYGRRPEFSAAMIPTGLPGLLFDQEFGLWVYAPIFALAIPGFVRMARARWLEAATAGALLVGVVAVASAWPMWRGGFNPPARFLLPVLPAMALGVAWGLRRGLSIPAAMLIGWSAWTGLAGSVDRDLVHRDRDGTAPFFRVHSGALEWTRLLPGWVLDESERARVPLTLLWAIVLGAAAAARKPPTASRVLLGCGGLLAATGVASHLGTERSGGRDAVRLLERTAAVGLPAGPVIRGEAAWTAADLAWGPLYEPHRHPDGAAIGSRLGLAEGDYRLELDVEHVPSSLPPPVLEVRIAGGVVVGELQEEPLGRMRGGFRLARRGPATLVLRGGGPLILKEIRLRRSTFSDGAGPSL
jgi:hypothetical protein